MSFLSKEPLTIAVTPEKHQMTCTDNEMPVEDPLLTMCPLCLMDVPFESLISLDCQCSFCTKCIKSYVEFEITKGKCSIHCPDGKCPERGHLSLRRIQQLVDLPYWEKYLKFRLNQEVENDPRLLWCPTPDCETYITLNRQSVLASKFECGTCLHQFCLECRGRWHPSLPCPTPSHSAHIKHCPKCAVPIEKHGGCPYVFCRRCSYSFCWLCLQSIRYDTFFQHYDNGSCEGNVGRSILRLPIQIIASIFIILILIILLFYGVHLYHSARSQ